MPKTRPAMAASPASSSPSSIIWALPWRRCFSFR